MRTTRTLAVTLLLVLLAACDGREREAGTRWHLKCYSALGSAAVDLTADEVSLGSGTTAWKNAGDQDWRGRTNLRCTAERIGR